MVDARGLLPGDDVAVVDEGDDIDPFWEVTGLMIEAIDAKTLHVFDAWLLGELARIAAELEVAGRRGRSGLTTRPWSMSLRRQCTSRLAPSAVERRRHWTDGLSSCGSATTRMPIRPGGRSTVTVR